MDTLVSVIMGSRSDWKTMKHAADTLRSLSVSHEVQIVPAHRTSEQVVKYAKSAEKRGIRIIIASASGAEHLAGILASRTHIPVLGVPLESKTMDARDSLLSILEMPAGVPVGSFAIGHTGAVNAALMAASMVASEHDVIRKALVHYREQQSIPRPQSVNSSIAM